MDSDFNEQYTFSYVDEEGDTKIFHTSNAINFRRKKIEELGHGLENEPLDSKIILLDTDIALKPEALQVQSEEEDEYVEVDNKDFFVENQINYDEGQFVDADGNTYRILNTEIDAEELEDGFAQMVETTVESEPEEGEVRDPEYEILRRKLFHHGMEFQCPVCERNFSQKGNLLRHYHTHTGDRPFACKLCGHRFTQKSNLQKHLATHNGDKRFECGVCHKGFVQKANLIRHLRIHTGEKPFACELCGHRFTQKGNLNKHMQLHTSEMEVSCDFCDCKFSTYTAKQRHESSVHRENVSVFEEEEDTKVNQCDECPASFRTKRALLKHRKYHK